MLGDRVYEGFEEALKRKVELLELQLGNATSALLEALDRLVEHRDAICDALLAGRRFQTIDDIELSIGDAHNCGRSVTIFHTDAGKLVYKPHDLRVDEQLCGFVKRILRESGITAEAQIIDSECGTCAHFGYCGGGCRALGLLNSGRRVLSGLTCKDVTKCRFFEDGWHQIIVQALPGWTNLSEIGS